ncbi:MAG: indolepyruvate oxidoreductase subunit beta [Bacteroidota bacterium]
MKTDIILAGVGGQGILTIAATIGMAASESNLFLKQAEVHGMSQRGGAVESHLRLSDQEIFSDLISQGEADIILSVEPMESLRYLPYLSENGWLVSNTKPYRKITGYPDEQELLKEIRKVPCHIAVDADDIASNLGSRRSSNIIMLGAATSFLNLPFDAFKESIKEFFQRKGKDVVEKNIRALEAGRAFAEKEKNS